ncbi:MAG: hypothetical protein A4E73_00010 [Syntrophaceae bacterium PtaU1.Bin231]|nr:MAG: hypothetical protein A4E73_00010 [Syntrophaceae bacterium PtaU1.Bin231]
MIGDEREGAGRRDNRDHREDRQAGAPAPPGMIRPGACSGVRGPQARGERRRAKEDGGDGGKGQLEGDVEKRRRRGGENDDRRQGQAVEEIPLPPQQEGTQKDDGHDGRPHDGDPHSRNQGEHQHRRQGKGVGEADCIDPQEERGREGQQRPGEKDPDQCDDADIEPGDGDDVGCPRPVEEVDDVAGDLLLRPQDHRGNHLAFRRGGVAVDAFADLFPETLQGEKKSVRLIPSHDGDAGRLRHESACGNAGPPQFLGSPENPGIAQPRERLQPGFETDEVAVHPRSVAGDGKPDPPPERRKRALPPYDALEIDRQLRPVGPPFRYARDQALQAGGPIGGWVGARRCGTGPVVGKGEPRASQEKEADQQQSPKPVAPAAERQEQEDQFKKE